MSLRIVISPAKSLDFESEIPNVPAGALIFEKEAAKLNKTLKAQSVSKLKDLMHISDVLAKLNWERNQNYQSPFTPANARPAIFAFNGDVYSGLDVKQLDMEALLFLQNRLYMLSGLYGLLRPFDLIQAYRLEMGTPLKVGKYENLYAFWGDSLTRKINENLTKNDWLINLASQEYFKAVRVDKLQPKVMSPVFKDYKNGQLKIISFYAKKARGLMVRYMAQNKIEDPKDLLHFDLEGYRYSESDTQKAHEPVFVR
ncbi:MAG: peroxide stress protein YaaA [Bacteroidetes bacterium]|nr:peroxide stress protein YaaA [Bacteroidota bacterium]